MVNPSDETQENMDSVADQPTGNGSISGSRIQNASDNIRDLTASLQNIGLDTTDPMHNVLSKLAKHLGNMSVAQDNLVKQNKFLLAAERKAKVDTAVRLLTNPMSVRLVRYNYHLRFHIEASSLHSTQMTLILFLMILTP